jgi:hypothetical protein
MKEQHSHVRCLEALLAMECEERDRHAIANRIRDAQLPQMKTLEEFDFEKAPQIAAAKIRDLAQGGYIDRSEPIVLKRVRRSIGILSYDWLRKTRHVREHQQQTRLPIVSRARASHAKTKA